MNNHRSIGVFSFDNDTFSFHDAGFGDKKHNSPSFTPTGVDDIAHASDSTKDMLSLSTCNLMQLSAGTPREPGFQCARSMTLHAQCLVADFSATL